MKDGIRDLITKLGELFILLDENDDIRNRRVYGDLNYVAFRNDGYSLTKEEIQALPDIEKQGAILYQECIELADEHLITEEGHPARNVFPDLLRSGYHVGPGEQDSYGWLTGVITSNIHRTMYKLVFG